MLFRQIFILMFLLLISVPSVAREGFTLKPSFMYYTNKVSSTATTGTTYQWIDIALGYEFSMGIFLGAMYHTPSFTSHGASDCTYQHNGYGPTVGFKGEAAYIMGTYFVDNKRTGCGETLQSGSHYQIDVGYGFSVGSFKVAPQLSYYNFGYTQDSSGESLTPTITYFGFVPMISLILDF